VDGAGVPNTASASKLDGKLKVHVVVIIPSAAALTGRQRGALELFSSAAPADSDSPRAAVNEAVSKEEAIRPIRRELEAMKARYGAMWFRTSLSSP
jgi:DnaJ-class molecular chaperone